MTSMSGGDAWDQEAKNCRAPALDFLASIVTNTGSEAPPAPPVIGIPGAIGVGLGGVITGNGQELTIKKSESGKSLASQSSLSSSSDSKQTPSDGDLINANGKRTPVDSQDESQQKQMKIEGRDAFKTPTLSENTAPAAASGPSSLISNLPMPAGQIPHMNNNGQFNQTMSLADEAGRARLPDNSSNTETFVFQNPAGNAPDAQKMGDGMQFPYYFTDMKGSTQQQSLVYPVTSFTNPNAGANSVDNITEAEAVQTGVM